MRDRHELPLRELLWAEIYFRSAAATAAADYLGGALLPGRPEYTRGELPHGLSAAPGGRWAAARPSPAWRPPKLAHAGRAFIEP